MSHIFISYRRADSAGHTGRLYDDLSDHFGQSCLFMDIDMKPGVDFAEDITKAVASCDVLLAVIGRQWLTSTDAARRRLADPGDYVRLEIAAALSRKIPVIPILVQGAVMPHTQDLPEDLVNLARRQAHELTDSRWKYDVGRLIKRLEEVVGVASMARPQPPPNPIRSDATQKSVSHLIMNG